LRKATDTQAHVTKEHDAVGDELLDVLGIMDCGSPETYGAHSMKKILEEKTWRNHHSKKRAISHLRFADLSNAIE
jgi:hypothetical protein